MSVGLKPAAQNSAIARYPGITAIGLELHSDEYASTQDTRAILPRITEIQRARMQPVPHHEKIYTFDEAAYRQPQRRILDDI